MAKFSIVSHFHNDPVYAYYFTKHYTSRVDCGYIIDDGPSTDNTFDIIKWKAPNWVIIERESSEWDAVAIDHLCRQIERQIDGWVVTLTSDEIIYATRSELDEILDRTEYDFIQTEGWQVIEHPSEPFDIFKGLDQFRWGIPEPMISRTIHRNQNDKDWEYSTGRHQAIGISSPIHPLLGDHKYAPKQVSFQHRLVDGARVGPLDQSRGFGLNKVGLTMEKLEAEYQEVLGRAVKFR